MAGTDVQRRILLVALTPVALALTLLGMPLAFVARQNQVANERAELSGAAVRASITVPTDLHAGRKPRLHDTPTDMHVAIYDGKGHLLVGEGPPDPDDVVRTAIDKQHPVDGYSDDDMVSAVPYVRGGQVAAVVRASSPRAVLERRQWLTFAAVGGAAMFAALVSMLVALRLAWRLSAPIKELTLAAEELGDGNFASRAPTSGIRDLDAVAESMNATAQRLGQLVDRERAFVSHASHQLRTPLTALRLRLDSALHGEPADLRRGTAEAMAIVDDLEATVEDLLAVSRGRTSAAGPLDLDALLGGLPQRWAGLLSAEGRRLVIRSDDPPVGAGRAATVRQVLDVLIDNAYRHGGGTVEVLARDASGALAIDVTDEGRVGATETVSAEFARVGRSGRVAQPDGEGSAATTQPLPRVADTPPEATSRRGGPRARAGTRRGGTGIGLGLARSLVVADGGRLLLSSMPGLTRATVLLPPADPTSGPPSITEPAGTGRDTHPQDAT